MKTKILAARVNSWIFFVLSLIQILSNNLFEAGFCFMIFLMVSCYSLSLK
ncbi:hypothetical protein [uncultured Clostridium sp.]|nr:hypothetical protein [uncultured Clostridium sp.]